MEVLFDDCEQVEQGNLLILSVDMVRVWIEERGRSLHSNWGGRTGVEGLIRDRCVRIPVWCWGFFWSWHCEYVVSAIFMVVWYLSMYGFTVVPPYLWGSVTWPLMDAWNLWSYGTLYKL